jgi:hypothetical protein
MAKTTTSLELPTIPANVALNLHAPCPVAAGRVIHFVRIRIPLCCLQHPHSVRVTFILWVFLAVPLIQLILNTFEILRSDENVFAVKCLLRRTYATSGLVVPS